MLASCGGLRLNMIQMSSHLPSLVTSTRNSISPASIHIESRCLFLYSLYLSLVSTLSPFRSLTAQHKVFPSQHIPLFRLQLVEHAPLLMLQCLTAQPLVDYKIGLALSFTHLLPGVLGAAGGE